MNSVAARPRFLHPVVHTAYAVVAIAPAAMLIVFLLGSLVLSGGQVSAAMDAKWAVVRAYPLFAVPTVLLVVMGAATLVLGTVLAVSARRGDVPALRGLLGPTAAAIVSAIGFSLLVPDGGTRSGDITLGDQWWGAVVSGLALVVLLIGIAIGRTRS